MMKILYLLTALYILSACNDPNLGPYEEEVPKDDAGYIQFDAPAVGQQSSYAHFYANGYMEATPLPISYTRDTIYWKITKQIDANSYEITEHFSINYFEDNLNRSPKIITLIKNADKVLLVTDITNTSPLLRYNDTLELTLANGKEYPFTDWKIGDKSEPEPHYGYVNNYKVKDRVYDRLDFYSDFTPTYLDGSGLVFAYNTQFGMVRYYGMNPLIGDVSGFDLIRNNPKPKSLTNTEWRLKNLVYNDGSVKSIEEVFWGEKDRLQDPNFTLNIKSETQVNGYAGCNTYSGTFSLDKENIKIINLSSTEVACAFTGEYISILSKSTTYNSNGETLIINTSYGNVRSLVYERITNIEEEYPLLKTEWTLDKVQYNNGDIVLLQELLGSDATNPDLNNFELKFMENNQLGGYSGCNTLAGEYKVEKSKIDIKAENMTNVDCKFSNEYGKILSNSTKFTADSRKLVIYSLYNDYKALEFSRKMK